MHCGLIFYDILILLPSIIAMDIKIGFMGLPHIPGLDGSTHTSADVIRMVIYDFQESGKLANVTFR